MKTTKYFLIAALGLASVSAQATLLITQFYEGSSLNKWVEVSNTGASTIDFTVENYYLTLWSNANTEAWKADTGTPSAQLTISTGTLASGDSLLFGNSGAVLPSYATADFSNNSVINFNGDDSVVLYTANTWNVADIADAVAFTDAGSEGANTSIYRLNTDVGFNTTAGSTFLDFPSVWAEATNAAVDSATAADEIYLGNTNLGIAVPEPTTFLLIAAGGLIGYGIRRRKAV